MGKIINFTSLIRVTWASLIISLKHPSSSSVHPSPPAAMRPVPQRAEGNVGSVHKPFLDHRRAEIDQRSQPRPYTQDPWWTFTPILSRSSTRTNATVTHRASPSVPISGCFSGGFCVIVNSCSIFPSVTQEFSINLCAAGGLGRNTALRPDGILLPNTPKTLGGNTDCTSI